MKSVLPLRDDHVVPLDPISYLSLVRRRDEADAMLQLYTFVSIPPATADV